MKYLIVFEPKDPVEENLENMRKTLDERGSVWSEGEVIGMYVNLSDGNLFNIVDIDDPAKLAKWIDNYSAVAKFKISPIMDRREWAYRNLSVLS